MENQTVSSKSIMLSKGVMLGIASILLAVTVYALGQSYDQPFWATLVSIVLTIVVIAMGLKEFKAGNGGFLKLGEALKIGLGISLISAIVYIIYFMVFINFVEPDFYTNMYTIQENSWIDSGMTDEQIDGAKSMYETMANPMVTTGIVLISSLFFGFITSLIVGLIMKKSNEEVTSI
ncbi:DUF4199 domain-containing protein [Urechidicola vernalis]|uniref:DUF4199 domain-containing protein n=1 Tax=Urechidicola vernalis TaxID=3075600 RepID=A0ABU2Y6I5_9FLAO|nr:DUF4199 domain-containing protein [Urechidicola sp. P050]MDT0553823.1 DUF4199 domain-containing protein [Urechidicola sp. P050]